MEKKVSILVSGAAVMRRGFTGVLLYVLFAFLFATSARGLAPTTFDYPYAADSVGKSWVDVLSQHGLRVNKADAFRDVKPFKSVEEELYFNGNTVVSVFLYHIKGKFQVRSTGLASSQVTITFEATRTVGEKAAWKKLLKKLPVEVDERLGSTPPGDVENLTQRALLQLQGNNSCRSIVELLATSPWPEAQYVLREGLDKVADACLPRMLEVVGRKDGLRGFGATWLSEKYETTADRARILQLIHDYPAPNDQLLLIIMEARSREERPAPEPVWQAPTCRTDCCKVCSKGQACGNSCISRSYDCIKGRGCACDSWEACP